MSVFQVLKLKPLTDEEIYQRLLSSVEYSINTDGYKWTFFKTGGGWGNVLRKYKDGTPGWKGKARALPPIVGEDGAVCVGKGKGKGKSSKPKEVAEEPMEVDDVGASSSGKRGGGKKRKAEPDEKAEEASKGKGRGKRAKVEEVKQEDSEEEEVVTPKGRGRGRGRGRAKSTGVQRGGVKQNRGRRGLAK